VRAGVLANTAAVRTSTPEAELTAVLADVSSGKVAHPTADRADDVLDAGGRDVVPLTVHTDGAWIWSESTALVTRA
jgi:hypothetical protein